eukprot:TRINITY_DN5626_c0_g1_i4.p2 TRINITY_DN5626_c0_g1~~TRINITY_DN5626_c0_g1_i4.p2  ORF type:complete len:143 (-),score=24.50 TRINITY_DN5626_c0_g1_i4:52-480(-)
MQDYRQKNIQMIRNCKLILALQVLQLQKEKKKGKKAKVVTSFEFKKYPFYGFQFHPEKAQYVWLAKIKACHTVEEIEIAQYLANTFVNQARQSDHNFSSCLLYTSDAADEEDSVDLCGRRTIEKKKKRVKTERGQQKKVSVM